MGGGGLIQLVAVGAQDVYITGQPQITFFKSVYRRHTNFAIEPVLQNINGNPKFGEKISFEDMYNYDTLTVLANIAEIPGISAIFAKTVKVS